MEKYTLPEDENKGLEEALRGLGAQLSGKMTDEERLKKERDAKDARHLAFEKGEQATIVFPEDQAA